MKYIDLHVHSTCSDGTFTPKELIDYAAKKGLAAIALTDHDTVDGLPAAQAAAAKAGVELVSGIEFSTEYQGRDVHILGLDIDPGQSDFTAHLKAFRENRDLRNEEIIKRLQEYGGFPITLEKLHIAYPKAVLTRAHFARWLFEHGYVKSIQDAFERFLKDDAPCFVPRKHTRPETAIQVILQAKGIPVLAHPLLYHFNKEELLILIRHLKDAGLLGLEAIYSMNSPMEESAMLRLARNMELKISGGSDFHGKNKPLLDLGSGRGNLKIPYSVLENLRQ